MPDVFRLCPGSIPDGEAILSRLQRKTAQLGAPYREAIGSGQRAETEG